MARIRTIKPEFWDSPDTADCHDPYARLLYIAMWCWADDFGVGVANLREMAAFTFPNDPQIDAAEFQRLCKEVQRSYGVLFYTNRRRPYYAIPSWDDHQRTERRAKRRNPPPDDPQSAPDKEFHNNLGTSASLQGSSAQVSVNVPTGTGEQGNRGTGEREPGNSATRGEDARGQTAQTLVAEWIDHQAKRPPGQVIGQIAKQIAAMLNEDIDYEDIRLGLQGWQTKGLHPSTLPSVVHEIRTACPQTPKHQQETDDLFSRALRRNGGANPDTEQKVIGA